MGWEVINLNQYASMSNDVHSVVLELIGSVPYVFWTVIYYENASLYVYRKLYQISFLPYKM